MALQNINVEFNDDGTARITLPEGKTLRVSDPAKVAEITKKLAEKLGPIIERHAAHTHIYMEGGKEKIVYHQEQGGGEGK